MNADSSNSASSTSSKPLVIGCLLFLLIPIAIASGPVLDWWAATRGESYSVTGVVPVRRNGKVYFVASGHSERTSTSTSSGNRRSTQTTAFPRLTSFDGGSGAQVAMRQYAPIVRFEYVDTVVRVLLGEGGRAWAVSTEREVGLHAVDPVTLADVIPQATVVARVPALSSGLLIESGTIESPVVTRGRELVFRTNAGDTLAFAPSTSVARELGGEGANEEEESLDEEDPRGNRAVEVLVEGRRHTLEPRVVPVFDPDGVADATTAYVVTQTSLDRSAARVIVTRWDTTGETPTEGWHVTLSEIAPECCGLRAWRYDGVVVIWYEHWLVALDDRTGARRWVRRL